MRRCYLLILFLPLFAHAQRFSAADVRQLKQFSAGVYITDSSLMTPGEDATATLQVHPIWQQRKDGAWLFVQQTGASPFNQVWHFYVQDDSTLIMQLLDFKDSLKGAELAAEPARQSNVYIHHLLNRHGCELYLRKNKTGYTGLTPGKDCLLTTSGEGWVVFSIGLAARTLSWQQIVFDKDGKEAGSASNTGYHFLKQPKSLK